MIDYTASETCWAVVHNDENMYGLCPLEPGVRLRSGLPYLEVFLTEELALAFIPEEYHPEPEE